MANELTREKMQALRDHFRARQHELLALTCALVETESPSGDMDGSGAVASVIAAAAGTIGAVNSIERITSEGFGEHVRIRAWGGNAGSPVIILGHTDTVHPRGSIKERPWRAEDNRIYGPGIFKKKENCQLAFEALPLCDKSGAR